MAGGVGTVTATIGAALFAGTVAGVPTGKPNLAWLRFRAITSYVSSINQILADSVTLVDWAYQSVPGESIRVGDKGTDTTPVPEPSGLALMALGAAGMAVLRRRRKQERNAD